MTDLKIVYLGRRGGRTLPAPSPAGDVIELFSDGWDDFGYKTTFGAACRIAGRTVELPPVRILVEGISTTVTHLDRLRKEGWNGLFPIPETNYISSPSDITFYEQLDGSLGSDETVEVAKRLRDASYLVHVVEDAAAKALVSAEGFVNSLQRERASIQAYLDGWRVFERQGIAVLDLGFRFEDVYKRLSTLELKFQSGSSLPYDVNVLIGPNGSGKSQVLHQMVQDWIATSHDSSKGFLAKPNLSQIVVVSYSPFERFPVDLKDMGLKDTGVYRYFGFRGRSVPNDPKKAGRIGLSHEFPKRNAARSLLDCLVDDARFRGIRGWAQKVGTVERVLISAFDFEFATVEVSPEGDAAEFYHQPNSIELSHIDIMYRRSVHRYVPIASGSIESLNAATLEKALVPTSGVTFFRDGEPIELSSGQRLFAYIVINILGAIRRNSLILIDEPELFLHPTLEIQFIEMLKTILFSFNSKALLATHSVVTVREMPSDCVHVFNRTTDGLKLTHPPFQTFGGDCQRISSYVFGDRAISKPFENWIREQLDELGSAERVIEALGKDASDELIVQIKAMERGQW